MAGTDEVPSLTAYVNARLIDPASETDSPGGVLTDGERIVAAGAGLFNSGAGDDARIIDCAGACLSPGLVDMRMYTGEPGEEHKETLATAGRAAVAGGVTSMVCLPNTKPVIDDMSTLEFIARRARKHGLAKVYCYGTVTKGLDGKELSEMALLSESGALAFTDGVKPVKDAQVLHRALSYAQPFGFVIVQHAEEPSLSAGGVMNAGETATRLGLAGTPVEAEIIMVERDIRLAKMTGGRLHFAHLSTAEAVDAVRNAKNAGLHITCDTAPPYFALNELAVGDYRTFAKLSPPLRAEKDRQAIIAGLIDGTIDTVASDHRPEDEEAKRLPFSEAAYGGTGLETLLPVTLELYHNGHMSLIDAISLITNKPAELMGLAAGRLEAGAAADLLVFSPEKGWKVTEDRLSSKSKNSPFDGRPVQGEVLQTIVDGRSVFRRGE
ncbi:MAG: dihydroorotase [Rhodospirillaceae bacterium TMED8]|nr:dihydroorotase [Magnetovibrio sp.]OUT48888.1 MAG: dihydroorotase [Rhodospirillaceae bacterium TMED8]|tara:strand:- start:206 stop:1519 length:1314 start_codon:yes stop_codon:yes gene_type:complete